MTNPPSPGAAPERRAPQPEVLAALDQLAGDGLVVEPATTTIRRLAGGDLLSVRPELRSVLYGGVLLLMAGISLFVKENVDRIGPTAIAAAGALLVAGLFVWIERHAEPFSWSEAASRHLGFDFLLLFAALLAAADLAFIESRFTPLGPNWTWHLLLVALGYGVLATRYDSRLLFSLALSTFAAWRGVAVGFAGGTTWLSERSDSVRWNAIVCGVLFVALGAVLRRARRKAHFEPTASVLGWLLLLGAMLAGRIEHLDARFGPGALWSLAALATGSGLAASAVRARRFGLFSIGAGAAYLGFLGVAVPLIPDALLGCYAVFGSSAAAVVALVVAHRHWFAADAGGRPADPASGPAGGAAPRPAPPTVGGGS